MTNKTYYNDGKECIICLARRKLIQVTPEEKVRQDWIQKLVDEYNVPIELIEAEIPLSYYKKGARGRVDILVSFINQADGLKYPLFLIECKAPTVTLTDFAMNQAREYDDLLLCKAIVLANGIDTFVFGWDEIKNQYEVLEKLPTYDELIKNSALEYVDIREVKWERPAFKTALKEKSKNLFDYGFIGEDSSQDLVQILHNLSGLLLDEDETCLSLPTKTRKFISDGGIRYTAFGNAAGGNWSGEYRYFLLKNENGDTEIVSLLIGGSARTVNDPKFGNSKGLTYFNVAIDDFESSHNSLQYNMDKYLTIQDGKYNFMHDGTLTNGKKGAAKRKDVVDYVHSRYPELVEGSQVILGELDNTKEFHWNQKPVQKLIAKFIDYAILRDEFRKTKS